MSVVEVFDMDIAETQINGDCLVITQNATWDPPLLFLSLLEHFSHSFCMLASSDLQVNWIGYICGLVRVLTVVKAKTDVFSLLAFSSGVFFWGLTS